MRGQALESTFNLNPAASATSSENSRHSENIMPKNSTTPGSADTNVASTSITMGTKRKRDEHDAENEEPEKESGKEMRKRLKEEAANKIRDKALKKDAADGENGTLRQPVTTSKKKKKDPHVPVRVQRAMKRDEQAKQAKLAVAEKRQAAIEDGTWDFDGEAIRRKEKDLNRRVRVEIRERVKAGEFGSLLPDAGARKQLEEDARLGGEPFVHPSRLGIKVEPGETVRKVNAKKMKYTREKLKREAQREVKARLRYEMFGEQYTSLSAMTEDERTKVMQNEEKMKKANRRAKRKAAAEDRVLVKIEKKAAKQKRVTQRQPMKLLEITGNEELVVAQPSNGSDPFADGTEEIKLDTTATSRRKQSRSLPPVLSNVVQHLGLSEVKALKYAERAAQNGITIEEYIERKDRKNLRTNSEIAQSSTMVVVERTKDLDETQSPTFFVDSTGSPSIAGAKNLKIVWTPEMLGDRRIKDLSKEEREARRLYLQEKRNKKHAKAGRVPEAVKSKAERAKDHATAKRQKQDKIVAQMMKETGKAKGETTKADLALVRRRAKRVLREAKRIKRDKVITRDRLTTDVKDDIMRRIKKYAVLPIVAVRHTNSHLGTTLLGRISNLPRTTRRPNVHRKGQCLIGYPAKIVQRRQRLCDVLYHSFILCGLVEARLVHILARFRYNF